MAWFKIDDGWWSHPKTLALSNDAIALWTRAGAWCCQALTDGIVRPPTIAMLGASDEAVAELVTVGYWEEIEDGWYFHDWDIYQEPSSKVKKRRADARERMQVVRATRLQEDNSGSQHVRANKTRTEPERSQHVRNMFAESSPNPDPTRPDPTRPVITDVITPGGKRASRGSRLPPGWTPPKDLIEQMRTEAPGVNHQAEHAVFTDYWIAQPGQKGVKTDWPATWRNWMRRAQKDLAQQGAHRPTRTEANLAVIAQYADIEDQQGAIEV